MVGHDYLWYQSLWGPAFFGPTFKPKYTSIPWNASALAAAEALKPISEIKNVYIFLSRF
jgi:hypothetical protein